MYDDEFALEVIWAAVASDNAKDAQAFENFLSAADGSVLSSALESLLASLCECFPRKAETFRTAAARIDERLATAHAEVVKQIAELPDDAKELEKLAQRLKPRNKRKA